MMKNLNDLLFLDEKSGPFRLMFGFLLVRVYG
jgi:hypothetical protein